LNVDKISDKPPHPVEDITEGKACVNRCHVTKTLIESVILVESTMKEDRYIACNMHLTLVKPYIQSVLQKWPHNPW